MCQANVGMATRRPGRRAGSPDTNVRTLHFKRMSYPVRLVLLVAMAFQLCWAAWGSYCSHERGAAAMHWGHHEHQHATDIPTGADDGDCAMCHFVAAAGCMAALFNGAQPRTAPNPQLSLAYRSYIPPVPERPERNLV